MEIQNHPTEVAGCSLTIICGVILTILTAVTIVEAKPTTPEFQVILNHGNYEQAAGTCKGLNDGVWDLPSPNIHRSLDAVTKTLEKLMESHNLPSVWIRLRRKDFPVWKNLDNTTFEGRVQTNGNPQKTCVLMKLHYEALVSDTCQTHGYGYACQLNACSRCPSSISPSNCFAKNGKCYFVGCDMATWFNAVNLCKKMEGELATFNTAHQLQEFIAGIKSRRENVCKHYWVGLRKTDWYFSDAEGGSLPEHYHWYSDNPRSEDGCAVLKKYRSGYYWESVNCTETHATICLKDMTITTESLELQTRTSVGSEDLQNEGKFISDRNTKDRTSEGHHWERRTDGRLDFLVVMWSFILVTVVVYVTYLMIHRRSKLKKFCGCFQRTCSQQNDINNTSGREQDAGGACKEEQHKLMDRKSTSNGLGVLNPPASTSELKVPSPCQVGGSTHSDTNLVHIHSCSSKTCTI